MCVNNLSKVALDSAAASRKSNALTTAPATEPHKSKVHTGCTNGFARVERLELQQ